MAAPTVAVKDSWTTAAVAVDNSSCPRTPDSWTTMPDDTRFMDKELSTYVAADTRRAFLNPSLSSLTGEMERNFKPSIFPVGQLGLFDSQLSLAKDDGF
nr:hypothetical protein Iba_chr13cCG9320 [Ipomoea batatas]